MKGRNTVSLKTKIKNDMWKVNYVVPFIKKHQFDEKGKADMLRHSIHYRLSLCYGNPLIVHYLNTTIISAMMLLANFLKKKKDN